MVFRGDSFNGKVGPIGAEFSCYHNYYNFFRTAGTKQQNGAVYTAVFGPFHYCDDPKSSTEFFRWVKEFRFFFMGRLKRK